MIGTTRRTTPDLASFANGAAIRYYDLNDAYASTGSGAVHPSDHIGACLAVAEAEKASAADALTAIVLAYEINCRLIDATDAVPKGWDPTIYSLPAVALAAGKLMKLSRDQLVQAVALALNDHIPMGQTRTQTNSDWKGLADSEAERNAVFAAQLARARPHRPRADLRGPQGLFPAGGVTGRGRCRRLRRRRTNNFKINAERREGLSRRRLFADRDRGGHRARQGDRLIDRIAALEIAAHPRGYEQAGRDREKWTPQNRDTADHSLPYLTVRAMVDGDITNASYAPDKLRDPKILALMKKTTVKPDPAFAKAAEGQCVRRRASPRP